MKYQIFTWNSLLYAHFIKKLKMFIISKNLIIILINIYLFKKIILKFKISILKIIKEKYYVIV